MFYFKNLETNQVIEFENQDSIGYIFYAADKYKKLNENEIAIYQLQKAKEEKLAQLNSFHESKEVKYLTIKIGTLQTGIFVNQEYRYLIDEQIGLLEIKKENGEVNPTWLYQNGVSLPLDLRSLKQIRLYIGKLTDDNFRARANNIKRIQALKTLEELEKFDIATGYRINQTLNF